MNQKSKKDNYRQKNSSESAKNGELLSLILEKAQISQRLCSINMGENDAFLTNFIYRSPIKFTRDFSYKFLSSIYHFILRDSQKKSNERFDEIINDQTIKNLNINKKLLIPALQRHTLAIININAEIFEKNDESIIENYIQEIYPEKFENYKNFLRNLDYERTGLKNILNVQQLYEQEHQKTLENILSIEELELLNEYSDFEIQMESANNFFYICENLRAKLIPSFYSPTDYKEIKMDYFNKGAFLIRRKEVNQLKNNNAIGGQIVWKSGKFNFEIEKKEKSSWFFGRKKNKIENEQEKILKEINEQEKILKEIEDLKKETETQMDLIASTANEEKIKIQKAIEANKHLEKKEKENKKQRGKLGEYIHEEFLKKQEEQLKVMKELANKGKDIKLYEIDMLINKFGNTEIIRNFVNSFGLIKIDPPEEVKLFEDENEIKIEQKEEKKLA